MSTDLCAQRDEIAAGRTSSRECLERCIEAASGDAAHHAFVSTSFDTARAAADQADAARRAGRPLPPLAGLAVGIKDLFDVRGEVTAAASRVLAGSSPATADAPAVASLRSAGAAFIGRSNMSEFAFSGVGINPHHGTPANAALRDVPRIPGGSTSGGAVAVAAGAAWAALGSDTGGSLRIPAALQGLVGFKNTARLVSREGAVPLSTTLDTVGAITRSVRDAVLLHGLLAGTAFTASPGTLTGRRFALPTTLMLDAMEPAVVTAFEAAIAVLRRAGAAIDEIALPPLTELARLNAAGGFSAAESWAWHRRHLAEHEALYDPRVAFRIKRGAQMSAADYIDLLQARAAWIARMEALVAPYDAVLSPTVPLVAPPIAPLLDSDERFFATNALLLRNPSAINFLDGCALSLPCQAKGEPPVGLMVWHGALRDDAVLAASLAIEAALAAAHR